MKAMRESAVCLSDSRMLHPGSTEEVLQLTKGRLKSPAMWSSGVDPTSSMKRWRITRHSSNLSKGDRGGR